MQRRATPVAAAVAAALLASAAWAALPEMRPPDFARAEAVRGSLKAMHRSLEAEARKSGHWLARRGAGHCKNAIERLDWRVTAAAYDAEVGEKIWRDCHDAYSRVH